MTLKLKGSTDGSVSLQAPADTVPTGTDKTLILPDGIGSAGQVLRNSSTPGTLEFGTISSDKIEEGNTSVEVVDTGSDGHITFDTEGSERARVDSSGKLLVGTASGRTVADVNGQFQIEGTNFQSSSMNLICNGNTPHLSFARSGGSSIGDNSLVSENNTLGWIQFAGADGTDMQSSAGYILCEVDGTPGSNDMPGRLKFGTTKDGGTAPTERVRIKHDGDTAFFTDSSGNFTVRSAATGTGGSPFRMLSGASSVEDGIEKMVIRTDGDLENVNNSYGTLSDVALKENIVDANSQWSDIKQLQIRNFNFKEETGLPTHTQIGLVAQEVETVSPGLVKTRDRIINETTKETASTKSVNASVLYMKAVKALQEAMARIETLEAKVAALEAS